MEVYPGIHQLKVPIPGNSLGFLNSYLVKTDQGSLLVDTGWNADVAFDELTRQLQEAGVTYGNLKYVVITHIHPDHYGLTGRVARLTRAKLVIHEIELYLIKTRFDQYENLTRQMNHWLQINGLPQKAPPLIDRSSLSVLGLLPAPMEEEVVKGGEHIEIGDFDFEILWTPGHAPGHICLSEKKRQILISGDHVLPTITPNVSMQLESIRNPLEEYLKSLKAVQNLPVNLVLPAHGNVFTDLKKRVEQISQHHEKRMHTMLDAFNGQPKTAYQIASIIPWSTEGVLWESLPFYQKRAAVTETISHLELLAKNGSLMKVPDDGMVWYSNRI